MVFTHHYNHHFYIEILSTQIQILIEIIFNYYMFHKVSIEQIFKLIVIVELKLSF